MPPTKKPATSKEPGFGRTIRALSTEVKKLREGINSFSVIVRQLQRQALKAAKKRPA